MLKEYKLDVEIQSWSSEPNTVTVTINGKAYEYSFPEDVRMDQFGEWLEAKAKRSPGEVLQVLKSKGKVISSPTSREKEKEKPKPKSNQGELFDEEIEWISSILVTCTTSSSRRHAYKCFHCEHVSGSIKEAELINENGCPGCGSSDVRLIL